MSALDEIKAKDCVFIRPNDVAKVLECDPQRIRVCAKEDPLALGFPVTVLKSRVLIPRLPFIAYCEGTKEGEPECI